MFFIHIPLFFPPLHETYMAICHIGNFVTNFLKLPALFSYFDSNWVHLEAESMNSVPPSKHQEKEDADVNLQQSQVMHKYDKVCKRWSLLITARANDMCCQSNKKLPLQHNLRALTLYPVCTIPLCFYVVCFLPWPLCYFNTFFLNPRSSI